MFIDFKQAFDSVDKKKHTDITGNEDTKYVGTIK
jgi:hypothetical protein